jgi:hypothetical protein
MFCTNLVYIPVSEYFSFAKIIHPPARCDISRSIITQVQLVLGTIKCHRCLELRESAIGMLTTGMSNRAVLPDTFYKPPPSF